MRAEVFEALRDHLIAADPVVVATVVEFDDSESAELGSEIGRGASILVRPGEPPVGSLGNSGLDEAVTRDALGHLDAGATSIRHYGPRGEGRRQVVAVFIEAFSPPPRMVIFGAVDFAGALTRVAKVLGYHVTVCDARSVFATTTRFPMADDVLVDWPDRYLASAGSDLGPKDAICVLTHDPKFDVPAIQAALKTQVGYLGAMGSRRTTAEREERLRESGVDASDIARVMAPIGLDIGARTPEETAVSICAEIIALRAGGPLSASLSKTGGPIHQRTAQGSAPTDLTAHGG